MGNRPSSPARLQSPPTAPTTESRLLELPAELRNRIYRLALVRNSGITVSSSGFDRDGLLSTCKQIRSEALQIFYYENKFYLDVSRWNHDVALAFFRNMRRLGLKEDRSYTERDGLIDYFTTSDHAVSVYLDGSSDLTPHWRNLIEGTKFVHNGELPPPLSGPEKFKEMGISDTSQVVRISMACTAHEMRDLPWSMVEDILTHQRGVLGAVDNRWLQDEG